MFKRTKSGGTSNKNDIAPTQSKRGASPSVISYDMNILGNIISEGHVDINGHVEGNIKCTSVSVRERGKVRGDVACEIVQIYGTVEGLVKAKSVHLFANAKVTGTIMHESISIEDGAFIDGKFKRTDRVFIDEDDVFASQGALAEEDSVMDSLRLISANEN